MSGASVFVRAILCVLVLSVPAAAQSHLIFENIEYESPGSTRNRLDVIMPNYGPAPGTPTIMYIHGGAWHTRDKTDDRQLYIELTRHGYAVVACNYTLASSGSPSFPQAVQDVKNVVRWVRMEGHHYNLSPMVVTVGPSAGGHLAMMTALTPGVQEFETLSPPLGGYRVQGFVSLAGFTDLEWHVATHGQSQMFNRFLGAWYSPETVDLYRSASPIFHVTSCDPPGGLIQGDDDDIVPFEHAMMMAEEMQRHARFVNLEIVPGANHSFDPYGGQQGVAQRMAAVVRLLEPHFASPDLNGDSLLNVDDFTTLINMYATGDPRADCNGDGRLNIDDFTAFINMFAIGC